MGHSWRAFFQIKKKKNLKKCQFGFLGFFWCAKSCSSWSHRWVEMKSAVSHIQWLHSPPQFCYHKYRVELTRFGPFLFALIWETWISVKQRQNLFYYFYHITGQWSVSDRFVRESSWDGNDTEKTNSSWLTTFPPWRHWKILIGNMIYFFNESVHSVLVSNGKCLVKPCAEKDMLLSYFICELPCVKNLNHILLPL